jgi:predicted dehydrogenase/GT2 family glycosyltransferase
VTTLSLAVIGCGRVFERFHLPAVRRGRRWRIVAVSDPSVARRDWARDNLPGATFYPSSEALLDASRADAVLITAPPADQADLAAQALSAGRHVLVEKPCGLGPDDVHRLAAAAEASGRHLRVGFNRRFHPSYAALKQAMEGSTSASGRTLESRLSFTVEAWAAHSGYLGQDRLGGGVIDDVASHQMDMLHWLLPAEIATIAAHRHHRPPLEEELQYGVSLSDGTRVECLARHGIGYLESLLVRDGDGLLLAHPTGFLRVAGDDEEALMRAASRQAWLDRKMFRIRLRRDPLLRSFEHQLEAFADLVAGQTDGAPLATLADAALVHDGLQSLRRGAGRLAEGVAGSVPDVTVIMVAGNRRRRAAAALRSVLEQDGMEEAEVLLVDLGAPGQPALEGSNHPSVRQLPFGGDASYGKARAEAVRRARGEVVAFLEEHTRVSAGWLRALRARFVQGPWVAVGPRVVSGNPNSGFSDAMGLINYGAWTGPQTAREVDMLPGNNSAYRREALLALGPELDRLLLADTVLQWRLIEEAGRLYVEPDAVLAHRYPTSLWSAAKGEYLYHVCFSDVRARTFGWTATMRLVYLAGSLLIPWLRLARMLKSTRESESGRVVRRNLLGVLYLLSAAVVGQVVGLIAGSRGTELLFTDYELNESRPTREETARRG